MLDLTEFIEEELKDSDKYLKIAEIAPDKYKPIFRDIAKEEKKHRELLKEIMEDMK